ncbi:carboxypeptidase-like regulatory domain-containing protein [Roseateles sp.]
MLLGLAAAGGVWAFRDPEGEVRELVNRQPIEGAHIKIDCRKGRWLHGSDSVRVAEATSGADGRFSFARADVRGCGYLMVYISKPGFRDAARIEHSAIQVGFETQITSSVPELLLMVRESEVKQLQFDGLLNESNAVRIAPPGPMPEADYNTVNVPFFESRRLATTPDEIRWVRGHYCARLISLWAALPAELQQKHLDNPMANVVRHPDVVDYCKSAAPAAS